MSMTIIVTRNVSDRMRGFLSSSMLELAADVYSAPHQSTAVRKRIWKILEEWFSYEADASIIMVWRDEQVPGGQSVQVLGLPSIDLVPLDGIILSRRSRECKKLLSDNNGL
jgi:CRISPR-associated protein Cas2